MCTPLAASVFNPPPATMCTPVKVVQSRMKPRKHNTKFNGIRKRKNRRSFRTINVQKFARDHVGVLGNVLTELCVMKLKKNGTKQLRYSPYQKFIGLNMLIGTTANGYRLLRKIFTLPSTSTLLRSLENFRSKPGIKPLNIDMLKMKVKPGKSNAKHMFLILDEISLRVGINYDEKSGKLIGFEDDGNKMNDKLASSALCLMAVGIIERWKYPIGYFYTQSVMSTNSISEIVKSSIKMCEAAGFVVHGVNTDQGSNFEKLFRLLGVKHDRPKFEMDGKSYFVLRDPPHLIKCARNFLEKSDVRVPNFGMASWKDIRRLHEYDEKRSLKLCPRLTHRHVNDLRFASRMKVRYATQVLSHSVASSLNYLVSRNFHCPLVRENSFCDYCC